MTRCPWVGDDSLMIAYHDEEWGLPVHDDRTHFEFLLLEGAQAGLSWQTILNKRAGYREAFAGFEPARVAEYSADDVDRLLENPAIVRNRLKVEWAVANARAFLAVQDDEGSFDAYLWGFVDGRPVVNRFRDMSEIPAETTLSRAMSKDLRRRGFGFVGPTIVYALLQSLGVVNDHLVDCSRWAEVQA